VYRIGLALKTVASFHVVLSGFQQKGRLAICRKPAMDAVRNGYALRPPIADLRQR
jgi:hypothetical protein